MAGAGFKTFNTGDVLTASDVNTYLMQQTVMVFDDAAARTTALTGVVAEGMLSYLKDTNAVEVYDGSSWVASDDPNAIQNSIVDAKGDLISATADNTPARLAVGADNTVLTADSSTSTGLKWAAASSPSFTSWTPTWTGVTVGNGTVTAQYATSGDLVYGYLKLEWGSTTSQSGDAVFTLPVTAITNINTIIGRTGTAQFEKSGQVTVMGVVRYLSTTEGNFRYMYQATSPDRLRDNDIASNSPYTWANGDSWYCNFWYRKA